jgi:hypothetical protein
MAEKEPILMKIPPFDNKQAAPQQKENQVKVFFRELSSCFCEIFPFSLVLTPFFIIILFIICIVLLIEMLYNCCIGKKKQQSPDTADANA